jgi:hypothetical protein
MNNEKDTWPNLCMSCGYTHESNSWHYRDARDGTRAYVCGAKLPLLKDKIRWRVLEKPFSGGLQDG